MAEEHNTERPGGAEFGQSVDEPDTTNDSREDDLMAVVVEPVPSRRITRKRLLATSVAAVMVLVAGLLSVRLLDDDGNRADGTSELETAGSNDDPDPTDETGPAADSDSSDSDDSSTTARVEGEAVASFSTATGELAWGGAGGNSPQWVLPWGDGFVALGVNYGSPALPEFSEEIQERFPEEIRDVVSAARGESDAITVADAQQALEEAGLMEEVLELLTENPDVMGLVSGPGPVGVTLATSSDGIDWVDLDASNLPVDATNFSAVASDGHHLVIVGQQWEPDMSRRSTNSLFTTDDLVTWQSHEFPSEPELELPQYVHSDTYVGSVAVGPNGWVALSQTNTWIDEQMLLPAEALDLADSWGTSIDSNGITIEEWAEPDYVLDENGNIDDAATDWDCCNESIAEHHYTWEELGITLDEYQSYMGSPGQSVVWSATWGESPQQSTLPGEGWGGAVAATDTGYLTMVHGNRRGATLYSSANGLDWVRADGIDDGWINSMAAVDGGVLLFGGSDNGNGGVWLADPDGTNSRPVAVPMIPEGALQNAFGPVQGASTGMASIVDAAQVIDPFGGVEMNEITVEHAGFSVTQHNEDTGTGNTMSVTIVDIATGAVVLDESHTWDWSEVEVSDSHEPVEPTFLTHDEEGTGYLDPATGEVIVTVPHEMYNDAWEAAWNAALEEAGIDPNIEREYSPDLWLVATSNGIDWLVEDLPDPDLETGYWPGVTAINGNIVLVGSEDGLTRYTLG